MKCLIQRVSQASVDVDQHTIGKIDKGILCLIGIEKHDDIHVLNKMANKLLAYRIFNDTDGKMNLNINDVKGEILAVSQFTLAANTNK